MMQNKRFTIEMDGNKLVVVFGTRIKIKGFEFLSLFVHREYPKTKKLSFCVSEETTGKYISYEKTEEEAIQKAKENLSCLSKDFIKKTIQEKRIKITNDE